MQPIAPTVSADQRTADAACAAAAGRHIANSANSATGATSSHRAAATGAEHTADAACAAASRGTSDDAANTVTSSAAVVSSRGSTFAKGNIIDEDVDEADDDSTRGVGCSFDPELTL